MTFGAVPLAGMFKVPAQCFEQSHRIKERGAQTFNEFALDIDHATDTGADAPEAIVHWRLARMRLRPTDIHGRRDQQISHPIVQFPGPRNALILGGRVKMAHEGDNLIRAAGDRRYDSSHDTRRYRRKGKLQINRKKRASPAIKAHPRVGHRPMR